jgi:N-acetylglucosamine-6-phosphate deacetylase
MSAKRLRARHYATGAPTEILVEDGLITAIGPATTEPADLEADWLAPAFFDLQINGGGGKGFTSSALTVDDIQAVTHLCHQHGVSAYLATVITSSFETLAHAFRTLRQAIEQDEALAAAIPGFHLEGPYISPEDGPRGAHPRVHVRPPDWAEFQRLQEAAGGRIRLVTLAPEYENALGFIERLVKSDVVVALGHTAATPQRIREAVVAGARLSTHLGNGCSRLIPRHENVLWEQLAADEMYASLITDGHHLPWTLVKCLIRGKTPARIILTCDASSLAGLPPGRYQEWEQEFDILPEGKIILRSQGVLAGSWAFTDHCLCRLVRYGGVSLWEAVPMVTEHPRRLLGLPVPKLAVGEPADVVLLREEEGGLSLAATLVRGEKV